MNSSDMNVYGELINPEQQLTGGTVDSFITRGPRKTDKTENTIQSDKSPAFMVNHLTVEAQSMDDNLGEGDLRKHTSISDNIQDF